MTLNIFFFKASLRRKAVSSSHVLPYNLANLSRSHHYFKCFQDLVLHPLFKESTGPGHYFIEEISRDLTANKVLEGLGCSMAEHLRFRVVEFLVGFGMERLT